MINIKFNKERITHKVLGNGFLWNIWKKENNVSGLYSEVKKNYPEKFKIYLSFYKKKYGEARRKMIIEKLGGKCCKCGFSDIRALQIDHVNGGGIRDLRSGGAGDIFYNKVLRVGDSSGQYQLLCANCNWIKRFENNEKGGRFL